MPKSAYNTLLELFHEEFEKEREHRKFLFHHFDGLITWLIGFAVAGISLIATRGSNVHFYRGVLMMMGFVVIFGLLYRLAAYSYHALHNKLDDLAAIKFRQIQLGPTDAGDLKDETVQTMAAKIQRDFPSDQFDRHVPDPNDEKELEWLKTHYLLSCSMNRTEIETAFKFMIELNKEVYDTQDEETLKPIEASPKKAISFKNRKRAVDLFYNLCIICFIVAIILVCVGI